MGGPTMLRVLTNMFSTQGMASNLRSYQSAYFKTGSAAPIIHIMFGMWTIGYGLEHAHLKHAEEAALQAKYSGCSSSPLRGKITGDCFVLCAEFRTIFRSSRTSNAYFGLFDGCRFLIMRWLLRLANEL